MTKEDRRKYDALRDFLNDVMPAPAIEDRKLTFTNKKDRERILKEKAEEFAKKARVPMKWRKEISDRLLIDDDDIVKATNTIIEMIEQELIAGGTVRISNFGDFRTYNHKYSGFQTKAARFEPVESWLREINDPLYSNEIGLTRTLKKKKLTRRDVPSFAQGVEVLEFPFRSRYPVPSD